MTTSRFDDLLSRLLDGQLNEQDMEELAELVSSDDECRREFRQQIEVAEGLSIIAGDDRSSERFCELLDLRLNAESLKFDFLNGVLDRSEAVQARRILGRWGSWAAMAIAGCLIVAFFAGSYFGERNAERDLTNDRTPTPQSGRATGCSGYPEPVDDSVAIVKRVMDATFADDVRLEAGVSVSPRQSIGLKAGLLQLQFFQGATLTVEGPALLEVRDVDSVVLHNGQAWAQVPVPARGFAILTPDTEVVDLGTNFEVEVVSGQKTEVRVIDGLVELYDPDSGRAVETRHELTTGEGVAVGPDGLVKPLSPEDRSLPLESQWQHMQSDRVRRSIERWKAWRRRIAGDPRVVLYYDFERDNDPATRLPNLASEDRHSDGTVIGGSWTEGRWQEKTALDFKRPSDRVRFHLPREFESLTLSAWVRIDGLDRLFNSLLLTDEWDPGEVHWQFDERGQLGLSINGASGTQWRYTEPLVDLKRLGRWIHVASTFDGGQRAVRHYFNGHRVSQQQLDYDGPVRIGAAELGNWGRPVKQSGHPIRNLNGRMDEFILFDCALADAELRAIFDAGNPNE